MEQILCVDLILNVIQNLVIPVGNDHIRTILECLKVINHKRSEERLAIFQRWLVDNHSSTLGLDPLHDTLNTTLPEIITIALHRQTIDTDRDWALLLFIPHIGSAISVVPCLFQYLICNEIFSCPVRFHNSLNQILRYILVISKKLLRVLR